MLRPLQAMRFAGCFRRAAPLVALLLPGDHVVLFNTSTGYKYLEVWKRALEK